MIEEIDTEILKRLPHSFQIFYGYVKETESEIKQENRARNKTAREKTKKKRGGV